MAKLEFIPNQITPDYWQQPKVKAWAEPILNRFAKDMDWIVATTGYGDKVVKLADPRYTQDLALVVRRPEYFDMDQTRTEAFLIAVGYHGVNPETESYGELWTKQQVRQEVA